LLSFLNRFLLLVFVAVCAAAGYTAWYVTTPVVIAKLPAEFDLPPGTQFRRAVALIEQSGVKVGRWQFELLARALGWAPQIKAGSYELTQSPTPLQLLEKLTRGDVTQAEVKLIEGWTFRQMRAALDADPYLRHDTAGLDEGAVLARIGAQETNAEGLFFPDTYMFAKGSSDVAVLRRAYRSMQKHLDIEWQNRDPAVPFRTPYEALIMASIVEKETGAPSERGLIAGVLVNRLRIGMRLQADPTVIYGLGESFDGNLTKAHLLADGPYNTYTRDGLPPSPIAMPGLESLRAALRPAKTDALYYVSRGDGTSEFSRSLADHNLAVNKYQRAGARRSAGRADKGDR